MGRFLEILLKRYNTENYELFLKAKFVLITTFTVIFTLFIILIYTSYLSGINSAIIFTESVGFVIMLFALGMLIKGNYEIAIHTILITGFCTVWIVLFIESVSIVTKLDTIVFIVALLAAMPLVLFKNRKPMIVYFLLNIIMFLVFNYYLGQTTNLTKTERLDYFLDNSVVMTFVFFVSFTLFAIYQQVLLSLKVELKDRKKAEKSLQESENRLSIHLKNTPVGAISYDLDFIVIDWNPAAEKIFGYTKKEAIGKSASELILHENTIDLVEKVFQNLLSEKGGERSINENISKDGRIILCDWYNTVLKDIEGKKIGIACLVNDITNRKRTHEMIIQSEKMMSVGGLAAGMAHEINNPLAGMMQNAQVVYNRLTKELPANDRTANELGTSMDTIKTFMERRGILSQLTNINQAGQRAAKIIENMLSFSKKSDSSRREVDLIDLINNTLELAENDYNLKKRSDFKSIEIIREFKSDTQAVFCEDSKIQQVVFNILKNASEAINQNKQQKNPPRIIIRVSKQAAMIRMEIEDNGPGIDEETRKRIFEPFFTTKGVDKGTGLGLSVSYFIIVDDHGGEMEVESTLTKGTKFIIKLPLRSD